MEPTCLGVANNIAEDGVPNGPKSFRCFAVNAYKVTTSLYSSLFMCLKVHP